MSKSRLREINCLIFFKKHNPNFDEKTRALNNPTAKWMCPWCMRAYALLVKRYGPQGKHWVFSYDDGAHTISFRRIPNS